MRYLLETILAVIALTSLYLIPAAFPFLMIGGFFVFLFSLKPSGLGVTKLYIDPYVT